MENLMGLREYAQARELLRKSVSPVENYIEATERLVCELRSELKQTNQYVEEMRPHWAQGYSDDSMAAQASTSALAEVWSALGVNNQTDCMQKLRLIVSNAA